MASNSVQFDLTARREKNLRVLKSIDENVIEVLADYAHVAVYQFDSSQRLWDRIDVEGSLFITRSANDPLYSVIVLNKKGPSDFTLDILSITKMSLQRPYIMMRCSAPSIPITFGIWSHNETELDAIYALLMRIALNKECPVAPTSPLAKAGQLMSLLKPKKDATTASSTQSPQSPTVSPNTATVASLKMSVSSSGSTESASKKSAALLSLLKPSTATAEVENSSTQAANVAISICTNGTTVGTSSSAMSMQLLSVLKSPSNNGVKSTTATTAIAIAASDTAGAAPGTGPGASISLASFPSTSTTKAAPVPTSAKFSSKHTNGSSGGNQKASDSEPNSQQQKQILEDQQRAELMLKLIKPRTTTVDDLLTDVDIAARVKAASVKVATADNSALLTNNCNALHSSKLATTTVTPTVPVAVTVTAVGDGIGNALPAPTSKEDMLKNILMGKKKPVVTSAVSVSAPVSAPPAQPTTTSIPAAISALNSKNSVAGNNAISVQLATPSAYKPASSVSPTTVVAATAASATPAVVTDTQKHITATAGEIGKQSISTQRSAELLAAALRNTANSIRVAQQMGTTQRSPLTSSPVLTSLYGPPIPNLGPSPAPSPASSGLPAPVAWASLSNGNLPVAAGTSALGGKAGANVTASAPAPARPVPVLISPSDLRNITATTTASR